MSPIAIQQASEILFDAMAPSSILSKMGDDASGALVVRFEDQADHERNRERAASILSELGSLVSVYPSDGLWSDLGVSLTADPIRTHGVGENPFHMDLVDRSRAPRYIALYCERDDPCGGGASRLSDVWESIRKMDRSSVATLQVEAFSYFTDVDVFGVGRPLEQFAVIPSSISAGVPVRFTSKMLPHLRKAELVDGSKVDPRDAAIAFEEMAAAVETGAVEHRLNPGEMLIFDQYRWAHSRASLGEGQSSIVDGARRLLKQTYVAPRG